MSDESPSGYYPDSRGIAVGHVLETACSTFARHFAQFFLIGMVSCLPMTAFFFYSAYDPAISIWKSIGLMMVLSLISSAFCDALVIFGTFQDMRHLRFQASKSIAVGISSFLPMLAVSLLISVVQLGGLLLLIIPGYVVSAVLAVSMQACVIEHKGPVESMSRSASLTKGSRWKIFGVFAATGIIYQITSHVIGIVFAHNDSSYALAFANSVLMIVWATYQAVAQTVIYHDLRASKEGVDLEQIAAVFN